MSPLRFSLPPLYAITNIETCPDPLPFTKRLFEAGAELLQLRAKSSTAAEMLELAKSIIKIRDDFSKEAGSRPLIIVNDKPEVCLASGADGIHLGQEDGSPVEARKLLGPKAIIGFSTHSIAEVEGAPSSSLDYLGFGPIFSSPTKEGAEIGIPLLSASTQHSKLPIVAIGGITMENSGKAFAAGAASVAVVSDLERAADLKQRISGYYRTFDSLKKRS